MHTKKKKKKTYIAIVLWNTILKSDMDATKEDQITV